MKRRLFPDVVKSASVRLSVRGVFAVALVILLSVSTVPNRVRAAAGDLDTTFGTGGKVTTDFSGFADTAQGVAVQHDGKIVVVGNTGSVTLNPVVAFTDSQNFAVARYDTNGSLDTTFGTGGKVTTDFFGFSDAASAVALQRDGKIVVVGVTHPVSRSSPTFLDSTDFAIARYHKDGTLDATFGTGGKVTTDFSGFADFARAVAVQPDGKIVVAGQTTSVSSSTPIASADSTNFAVARYDKDGTLDATFGTGGKVTTDFSGFADIASAVAVHDGKIIVAGFTRSVTSGSLVAAVDSEDFALARYDKDGTLDATFGTGGKVTTDFAGFSDEAAAIAVHDGKIVVAGTTRAASRSSTVAFVDSSNFAVARYDKDGSLDATFGAGGKVTTDFSGFNDIALGVALQHDGKIVVVGETTSASDGSPGFADSANFAVARYDKDGSLDATFGTGGKVTTDFFGFADFATAVAVHGGKIIVVGESRSVSTSPPGDASVNSLDFAVARYDIH